MTVREAYETAKERCPEKLTEAKYFSFGKYDYRAENVEKLLEAFGDREVRGMRFSLVHTDTIDFIAR